jgi:FKBP-type peptidyl-prolyl cis-trans isomerase FkpA
MIRKYWSLLIIAGFLVTLSSCLKTDPPFDVVGQYVSDTTAIGNYIRDHHINGIKLSSGVVIVVDNLGKGVKALTTNTIEVGYTGKLFSNGSIFQTSSITSQLSGLIDGWKIALTSLPAGSKATVYIPSVFGYGETGSGGGVPPNSILIFDLNFKRIILSDTEKNKFTTDTAAISKYLTDNSISTQLDSLGLRYSITNQGNLDSAINIWSPVKMTLTLKKLDVAQTLIKTYDYVPTDKFDGRIANFMRAINIVAPKMHSGGKATIYVPSAYGYATNALQDTSDGTTLVAPGTNFILEIEIDKVYHQ